MHDIYTESLAFIYYEFVYVLPAVTTPCFYSTCSVSPE